MGLIESSVIQIGTRCDFCWYEIGERKYHRYIKLSDTNAKHLASVGVYV